MRWLLNEWCLRLLKYSVKLHTEIKQSINVLLIVVLVIMPSSSFVLQRLLNFWTDTDELFEEFRWVQHVPNYSE
jgi:hypothetical protein